jgi:hypothetical protein
MKRFHRNFSFRSTQSSTSESQQSEPVTENLRRLPEIEDNRRTDSSLRSSATESESTDVGKDPLGLYVIQRPTREHKIDIVFVHGLGGTSRLTWSKNKDLNLFWPYQFLKHEPEFDHARIFSFGYSSEIKSRKGAANSIHHFAKTLLYSMKNGKDEFDDGSGTAFDMGKVTKSEIVTGIEANHLSVLLSLLFIRWADSSLRR